MGEQMTVTMGVMVMLLAGWTTAEADQFGGVKFGENEHKPLGVYTMTGFTDPLHFFHAFVFRSIPVKFHSAAKNSPAFYKWTDNYFLSLDVPDDNIISVETRKKEDRERDVIDMHFQDFVSVYNISEYYMVNRVPEFLEQDVVLPAPLQCDPIAKDLLVDNVMWLSSGGTKSVVHTDSVENILCVLRGSKDLVLVDPHVYGHKIALDHPEGSYSGIDVDSVDYAVYPDLLDVEYHHLTLDEGDCLYIPYKWIHQVRSYGSNIAVNVWWDHHKSLGLDLSSCSIGKDYDLTFDKLTFWGFEPMFHSPEFIRDQIMGFSTTMPDPTYESFCQMFLGDLEGGQDGIPESEIDKQPLRDIFTKLDKNMDNTLQKEEVLPTTDEDWVSIADTIVQFEETVLALEQKMHDAESGETVNEFNPAHTEL